MLAMRTASNSTATPARRLLIESPLFLEGLSGRHPTEKALGEVEVQSVQQLDGWVRRVHRHVGGDVEQRLRVVEDDPHARVDEVVARLLGRLGRNGEDADDDVLVPDDVAQ